MDNKHSKADSKAALRSERTGNSYWEVVSSVAPDVAENMASRMKNRAEEVERCPESHFEVRRISEIGGRTSRRTEEIASDAGDDDASSLLYHWLAQIGRAHV